MPACLLAAWTAGWLDGKKLAQLLAAPTLIPPARRPPPPACSCTFSVSNGVTDISGPGYRLSGSGDASCTSITLDLFGWGAPTGCSDASFNFRDSDGVYFSGIVGACQGARRPGSAQLKASERVNIGAVVIGWVHSSDRACALGGGTCVWAYAERMGSREAKRQSLACSLEASRP